MAFTPQQLADIETAMADFMINRRPKWIVDGGVVWRDGFSSVWLHWIWHLPAGVLALAPRVGHEARR